MQASESARRTRFQLVALRVEEADSHERERLGTTASARACHAQRAKNPLQVAEAARQGDNLDVVGECTAEFKASHEAWAAMMMMAGAQAKRNAESSKPRKQCPVQLLAVSLRCATLTKRHELPYWNRHSVKLTQCQVCTQVAGRAGVAPGGVSTYVAGCS